MNKTLLLLAAAALVSSANAALLLDRGVVGSGITVTEAWWINESTSQNFADSFTLGTDAVVTRFRLYSGVNVNSITNASQAVIRLYDDNAGSPGTLLSTQTVDWVNSLYVGSFTGTSFGSTRDIYAWDFNLSTNLNLTSGVTYWIGAAGDGFDFGQAGTNGWDNDSMAQFSGAAFSFNTGAIVGDQAFQLYGDAVPEPATMAILGAGALALARRRKKA